MPKRHIFIVSFYDNNFIVKPEFMHPEVVPTTPRSWLQHSINFLRIVSEFLPMTNCFDGGGKSSKKCVHHAADYQYCGKLLNL